MYARVTTARIKDGANVQDGNHIWHDEVAPLLKQVQGVRGVYALANADTREALTIVLYESKESADAFVRGPLRDKVIGLFQDLIDGDLSVKEYEVGYHQTI